MGILDTLRYSLYGNFSFQNTTYPLWGGNVVYTTPDGQTAVPPTPGLAEYASRVYQGNGPIFSLIAVRQLTFSTVEFKFQNLETRELFGRPELRVLEEPWQGATTQNLLARCEVDASLAGNSWWVRDGGELVWLRPDWVDVILMPRRNGTFRKAGIRYYEGGHREAGPTIVEDISNVVHYMPIADPLEPWKGMSWITPVIRETMVDWAASTHQQKFFEQGASKRMAAVLPKEMTPEQFGEFKKMMESQHAGVDNAHKTAYIGGGADLTVIGTDLKDLDLSVVQGGLETRMAAAAGVPAVVVGFREGMQGSTLNAGNYGQSRRRFADGTLDPLWREVVGSFAKVVRAPADSRLWYDTRNVPFLREDAKDEAQIFSTQAGALRQLLDAGFEPDAAVKAAKGADLQVLSGKHSGKLSVQLQPMDQPPDNNNGSSGSPAASGASS